MENSFLESIARSLNVELPRRDNLDDYLDLILPEISRWGEDLYEQENYVAPGGKPWLEVRDEDNFFNTIVHFFNENGEYLRSTDGNVIKGKWRLLENTNKMIIELGGDKGGLSELYELAFLNKYFFILQKHGNQLRNRRYFVMGFEPAIQGLEWRDYVEALFNIYRSKHRSYQMMMAAAIIVVIIVILLSIF